jgi:hypothetical protein
LTTRQRLERSHKEGRALRTETTINDTRDFAVGRRLVNLPKLKEIGFSANRRLLDVQRTSSDCAVGEAAFRQVCQPAFIEDQRVAALRFGDPRVQALLSVLVVHRLLLDGFSNRDLREHLAPLLGITPGALTAGKMTYDLRRLRLHGLIERIPHTHRYQVTAFGMQIAVFFTRAYSRLLRPGLAEICDPLSIDSTLRRQFDRLEHTISDLVGELGLAA